MHSNFSTSYWCSKFTEIEICGSIARFSFFHSAVSSTQDGKDLNVRHEQSVLETALKELDKSRSQVKSNLMKVLHDLSRREERASILALTGGSPGMYEFYRTGQLLPILIGTKMLDRSGTNMEVPILGAERERQSGNISPLGGTMEDPEGGGE